MGDAVENPTAGMPSSGMPCVNEASDQQTTDFLEFEVTMNAQNLVAWQGALHR